MKNALYIFLFLVIGITSCEKNTMGDRRDQDEQKLSEMLKEIKDIVDTVPCTDPSEWSFIGIGSKSCGGVKDYIAYPHAIDTAAFKELVKEYNEAEAEFNIKYKITSDCMVVEAPIGIICQDGKAVLVYENKSR